MFPTIVIDRMNEPAPRVFAIILNWNDFDDTYECVNSLRTVDYPRLDIVLVDNNSSDGSAAKLREAFPSLPLIVSPHNSGYAAGNNAGILFALEQGAEYVLILNNDVVVDKDFLFPLLELMQQDSRIGVASGKIFYYGNRERVFYAAGRFSKLFCTGLNFPRDFLLTVDIDSSSFVDYVCGCMLLVRREVFVDLGLFDERFFMYFEDIEFSRRVAKQFFLAYVPQSVIYHKCGAGLKWRSLTEVYLYYHTRNRLWVFRNDQILYRLYVGLFTISNALAKACAVSLNLVSDRKKAVRQLLAITKGIKDGFFGVEKTIP